MGGFSHPFSVNVYQRVSVHKPPYLGKIRGVSSLGMGINRNNRNNRNHWETIETIGFMVINGDFSNKNGDLMILMGIYPLVV
jgi:hypothetical protein